MKKERSCWYMPVGEKSGILVMIWNHATEPDGPAKLAIRTVMRLQKKPNNRNSKTEVSNADPRLRLSEETARKSNEYATTR
jgi:hypothetical protein